VKQERTIQGGMVRYFFSKGMKPFLFVLILSVQFLGCNGGDDPQGGLRVSDSGVSVPAPTEVQPNNKYQSTNPAGSSSPDPNSNGSTPPAPPSSSPPNSSGPSGPKTVGASCHSDDRSIVCLALKYLVYSDSNSRAVIDQNGAIQNIQNINKIWSACKIQFQIDKFIAVDPRMYDLNFNSQTFAELDTIRRTFEDGDTLLVVTSGEWVGSLGSSSANAWTQMPGGVGPFGSIFESSVATYSNIYSHELGHYLDLAHVNDTSNAMNPVIYTSSTSLYASQCRTATSAAQNYWGNMLR
jgi:hypothetical protein